LSEVIIIGGRNFTILYPGILRPLTQAELLSLRTSIKRVGEVLNPVACDENDGVIDGANRLRIAAELGLSSVPVKTFRGLTEEEKRDLAIELNEARRQLTPEDREKIKEEREMKAAEKRRQGKSTRQIAKELGVSQPQIIKDLKEEGDNQLSPGPAPPETQPAKVTGRDGKQYPARKPRKPKKAEEPAPASEPDAPPPEIKSRGVGVNQAYKAIKCLQDIPLNDGLRRNAFAIVEEWIKMTRKEDLCRSRTSRT
jgi:hypothetical protein